jgi:hypothetical protein
MSRQTFERVVGRLERNNIFISTGYKPQRSVTYQFGIFLMRYGILGSSAIEPAMKTSVGEGTVVVYCERVVRAIREMRHEFVGWPDARRKLQIKQALGARCGFDGVIGVVDGSHITLAERPRVSGVEYLSRNREPSVSVLQASQRSE